MRMTMAIILAAGTLAACAPGLPATACIECPTFISVPGGTLIGKNGESAIIAPFRLARTETTFDQWMACVADGVCRAGVDDHRWGRGDRPVINVSVVDAEAYASWLGSRIGQPVRLPTADEWQWAAMGGPGGSGQAVCRGCGTVWDGVSTAPTGSVAANGYGLADMRGNVWEVTATCWPEGDAMADPCLARTAMGGAWYYGPGQSGAAVRVRHPVGLWSYTVGFRVALDAD